MSNVIQLKALTAADVGDVDKPVRVVTLLGTSFAVFRRVSAERRPYYVAANAAEFPPHGYKTFTTIADLRRDLAPR